MNQRDRITWHGYCLNPKEEEFLRVNRMEYIVQNPIVDLSNGVVTFTPNRSMYTMPFILLDGLACKQIVDVVLHKRDRLGGQYSRCPNHWLQHNERKAQVIKIGGRKGMLFNGLRLGDVQIDPSQVYILSFHFQNGNTIATGVFDIVDMATLLDQFYRYEPAYNDGSGAITLCGYFGQSPKIFFGNVEATNIAYETETKIKVAIPNSALFENITVPISILFQGDDEKPIAIGSFTFTNMDDVKCGQKRHASFKQGSFELKRSKPNDPIPPEAYTHLPRPRRRLAEPIDCAIYQAFNGLKSCLEKTLNAHPDVVNQREDSSSFSVLHHAAIGNQIETATLLLDAGADINATDEDDNTPLHVAVHDRRFDMVKFLLSRGADPNYQNAWGDSPFHFAVVSKNDDDIDIDIDIVKLIDCNGGNRTLQNGADDSVAKLDEEGESFFAQIVIS